MNVAIFAQTTASKPPLRAMTLRELLDKQFNKRDYLIEPILKQGESMMLWAAPGVGKTMLALSLAIAVAGGGELIGLKGSGRHKVLIVDGEMNEHDLQERFSSLLGAVEGADRELALANITLIARQGQHLDTEFPDLAEQAGQQVILERALKGGFDLVILDNFSTLASLEDENSAAAMDPVLRFLMQMKQANLACMLIHHSSKEGTKYRGSSKIETTFEAILGLKKPSIMGGTDRASFDLEFTKFRNVRSTATQGKKCWLRELPKGQLAWCHELSEGEVMARMLSLLRGGTHGSQRSLAAALGVSTATLSRLKARALAERHVSKGEWDGYLAAAGSESFPAVAEDRGDF